MSSSGNAHLTEPIERRSVVHPRVLLLRAMHIRSCLGDTHYSDELFGRDLAIFSLHAVYRQMHHPLGRIILNTCVLCGRIIISAMNEGIFAGRIDVVLQREGVGKGRSRNTRYLGHHSWGQKLTFLNTCIDFNDAFSRPRMENFWANMRVVKCKYYVSQKPNGFNNNVHSDSILLTFIYKLTSILLWTRIFLYSNISKHEKTWKY